MTPYVVARPYRAPDIILKPNSYTKAVDIWSIGCIIYEMFTRTKLFTGMNCKNFNLFNFKKEFLFYWDFVFFINSDDEQISETFQIVGKPSDNLLVELDHETKKWLRKKTRGLEQCDNFFESRIQNVLAVDLLRKCLNLDPSMRITSEDALKYEYVVTKLIVWMQSI